MDAFARAVIGAGVHRASVAFHFADAASERQLSRGPRRPVPPAFERELPRVRHEPVPRLGRAIRARLHEVLDALGPTPSAELLSSYAHPSWPCLSAGSIG